MSEKATTEGPGSRWQLEFSPEIQALREPILAALVRAMDERTVEAVQEAQSLAGVWLGRHPEDLAIWDAGEPVAMLAAALDRGEEGPGGDGGVEAPQGRRCLALTPPTPRKKAGYLRPRPVIVPLWHSLCIDMLCGVLLQPPAVGT